jgi:hypothetical protein
MSIVEDMKPSGMRRAGSEVAVGNYNYDYNYDYNYNYNRNYNRNYNGNVNCINAEVAEGKARRRGVRRDASDPLSTSPDELFVGTAARSAIGSQPERRFQPKPLLGSLSDVALAPSGWIGARSCLFRVLLCSNRIRRVLQAYPARVPTVFGACSKRIQRHDPAVFGTAFELCSAPPSNLRNGN